MEGSSESAPGRNDDPSNRNPEEEPYTEGGPSSVPAPASTPPSEGRLSQRLRDLIEASRLEDEERIEADRRRAEALEEANTREREGKELYFFYGSLQDPSVLQQVLGSSERPVLRPAVLHGWHMKMWGPYPALVYDGPVEPVRGMVYEAEGSEAKDRLASYETVMYREHMCEVSVDGSNDTVTAKTFVWAGGQSGLMPGKFNLREWQQNRAVDG